MGLWAGVKRAGSWAVKHPFRAGAAVATGGGSEVARSAMGQDNAIKDITGHDPLGGLKNSIEDGLGFGVDEAGKRPDAGDPKYLGQADANAQDLYAQALDLRGQAAGIRAQNVAAPGHIGVGTAVAPQLGPAAQASAAQDPRASALLYQAATGGAPSVAEAQLRAGQDASARNTLGLVGATRGPDRAGQLREARLGLAQGDANTNQQAAALRAGEMATARGMFAQNAEGQQGVAAGLSQFNAGSQNQMAQFGAGQNLEAQQFNVRNAYEAAAGNRAADLNVATGNADRDLSGQTSRIGAQQGALGVATGAVGQQGAIGGKKLDAATSNYAVDKGVELKQKDARQQLEIGLLQGATKLSDERAKDDIEPLSTSAADRLAQLIADKTKTWSYKGSDEEHAGPMAQDLLQDPLGRRFVHKGEDGLLRIDEPSLSAVMTAAALRSKKRRGS